MKNNSVLCALTIALLVSVLLSPGRAEVELPPIFCNNMVVQQGVPLDFWGWASPDEKVTIKQSGVVVARTEGHGKETPWHVQLPVQKLGSVPDIEVNGSNSITLHNILAGEVWLFSGQSNMVKTLQVGPWCHWGGIQDADRVIASATDNEIRLYLEESGGSAAPQSRTKGTWLVCNPATAPQFSAVAYFFGLELRAQLKAPVGLIVSAVGGTPAEAWTPAKTLQDDTQFKANQANAKTLHNQLAPQIAQDSQTLRNWQAEVAAAKASGKMSPPKPALQLTREQSLELANSSPLLAPGGLYNGKIRPLVPVAIQGVVWYQGEANGLRGDSYADIMTHLIEGWRQDWGRPFPFIFVALAGFGKPEAWSCDQGSYPLVREASMKVAAMLPRVGVISAVDVGEANNIHPLNKQPVGRRAALWALQNVYNQPVVGSGPTFGNIDFFSGRAVVHFSGSAAGLTLKNPAGFELAGADRKFVPAQAELKGDVVEVTAPGVAHPVALRYAFQNFPQCTIYNGAGLPSLPFRTDNWPVGITIQ